MSRLSQCKCDVCGAVETIESVGFLPTGWRSVSLYIQNGQKHADLCGDCWDRALFGMTAVETENGIGPQE